MKIELKREDISAADFRFAIVVSRWNDGFTSKLEEGALEALREAGVVNDAIETFRVPGAFELPLACLKAAETDEFDAVIALGVVIRGDTPHFDYVAGEAASGISQAALSTGIPVMFGVITADNVDQVAERCGKKGDNKGYEAAMSAVEMANLMREFRDRKWQGFEGMDFPDVV